LPRLSTLLRWLAVPLTIAAVAFACIAAAQQGVRAAEARCAAMVGGSCVEGWHTDVVEWAIYLGLFVGVALIVVLSAWIAPAAKRAVAVIAALIGLAPAVAGYVLTGWPILLPPILLSAITAAACVAWVWRRHRPASTGT
jgi:cytochrome bd-type quinol oxidase subunit 2